MEYPRLDHTGQHKKERPKQSENKKRRKESRRPELEGPGRNMPPVRSIRRQVAAERHGLDHPGWNKQHEPPQPGLDDPGTKGDQTPQTGTSGVEQAAGATAPTTRRSRDTWLADAPDWSIWGRTRRSGHNHRGR